MKRLSDTRQPRQVDSPGLALSWSRFRVQPSF
jgi:hypothetical protein